MYFLQGRFYFKRQPLSFQITTNGILTIYAGLKGVKLCVFRMVNEDNRDCYWRIPVVTLEFQQGLEDGSNLTNELKIMSFVRSDF